jgi:hypothetical protein
MAPEAIFDVVARGPRGDTLEVEFTDEQIILYGWLGSTVVVFHEGIELGASCAERTRCRPRHSVKRDERQAELDVRALT